MQIGLVLLLALTAAVHLVLGGIIYKEEPRSLLNRLCLGFGINASFWSIAVLMVTVQQGYAEALFWIRISHAVAATTPWFAYALVHCFAGGKKYPSKKVFFLLGGVLALALLSLTPAVIKDVILLPGAKVKVYGPLFPLYALFFTGFPLFSLYNLLRQLRLSRGLVRLQIRYFFGGILLSFILGISLNLFLPLMGLSAELPRGLGPVCSLISTLSISYAIVRYRLLDINLALRKILVYVFSLALLSGVCVLLFFFMKKYFTVWSAVPAFYFTTFILLVIVFQPLKEMIQRLVDHYFFRGAYHYFDTLKDIGKAMVSILQRDDLLVFLVHKVVETIYLQSAVLYLRGKGGFFRAAAQKYAGPPYSLAQSGGQLAGENPLLAYLEEKGEVLLKTDLKGIAPQEKRELLLAEMKRLQAGAVVPLVVENRLEGVLALGYKLSGEPYSQQDVGLLVALASQVTVALKNAQLYQEVWEVKRYLENILKNMGNGLIAVDACGQITTFNSAAERLTGIGAEEALGRQMEAVLSPHLCRPLWQVLQGGGGKCEEELEIFAGGLQRFLYVQAAAREEEKCGAILVLSDITRIKELEKEKNQTQRLVSLGALAAGMAHEIKNPLVSIQTFAELLPEKYDDPEFRCNFSRIVQGEIKRINKLIMELLHFTRSPRPVFTEVESKVLVKEIVDLLTPQLNAQKIQFYQHYGRDLPPLKADWDQLKQALLNICLNGVQAMPGGGELRVEVLPPVVEETFSGISSSAAAEQTVTIRIQDTGTGISFQQKERVFDPFFTTKSDGVGIGLSISHKIITEHGGTLHFHSDRQGTVFEICLPAASSNDPAECLTGRFLDNGKSGGKGEAAV